MESENCVIVCLQLRKYKSHHDSSLSVTKNLQPVMVLYTYMQQHDGKPPQTKTDDFSEKYQTAFAPPSPHFQKIILQFCRDTWMSVRQIYPQ